MDLRKRFESFIKIFPGFESVDALLDDASYADKERAAPYPERQGRPQMSAVPRHPV